jgi:hypothetical protein
MDPMLQYLKRIQSPLYDRRLMILILKKTNGRRSFSENCRCSKIKDDRRDRRNEPTKGYTKTENQTSIYEKEEGEEFRITSTDIFTQ